VRDDIGELEDDLEISCHRLKVLKNKIDDAMDLKQKVIRDLEMLIIEKNICSTKIIKLKNRIKRINNPSVIIETIGEINGY
jgi:hypothetical protein